MSNPYEPSRESSTVESSGQSSRLVRWRLAPTLFFGTLGAVGTAVAILLLIACVPNIVRMWNDVEFRNYIFERKMGEFGLLLLSPPLTALWGISWLFSAKCFWQRRWKMASSMVIIGVVSLAVLISLTPAR